MLVQRVSTDLYSPHVRLDFLRGVAAIYVLINHTRGAFFLGGGKLLAGSHSALDFLTVVLLQLTSFGSEAVILFFVLSGFAMAHSVRNSSSKGRFYAKRIIRIWPPYIAATILALFVGRIVGAEEIQHRLWPVLFYINPSTTLTPQFWSLPYEVLFYVLCPFVLASEKRARWMLGVAAVTCVIIVALFGLRLNPSPNFFANFVGEEMLFFAVGALTYWHLDRVPKVRSSRLLVVLTILMVAVWLIHHKVGHTNIASSLVMIAVAVLLIRNLPEQMPRWLNAGHFSYSIYVFHYSLIAFAAWLLKSQFGIVALEITNPLTWMLVVPPVLGACYGLYFVTERFSNGAVASIRRSSP